jgi:fructose-1,6-bisphosphatase/inositol monophosphatase family enzyme
METSYSQIWDSLTESLSEEFATRARHPATLKVTRKQDGSAVSEADLRVQDLILNAIAEIDPDPCVVAEENLNTTIGRAAFCDRIWVVDPIDGTAEFLDPNGREYCSAVAVVEDRVPVACLIFSPVLGHGGAELAIAVDGDGEPPRLNGEPAAPRRQLDATEISATGGDRAAPRPFEEELDGLGIVAKTRATSLTLDMARTCLDLSPASGLGPFRWFHRANQRAWDALPGLALARAVGLASTDLDGSPLLPIENGLLEESDPLFPNAVVASPSDLPQVLQTLRAG